MVWNEMTLEELEQLGCSWHRFCHGVELTEVPMSIEMGVVGIDFAMV